MKKYQTLLLVTLMAMTAMTLASCDDDHGPWPEEYYFDVNDALDAYFTRYGDFGTDDETTAQWFDHQYRYASDRDYRDFITLIDRERTANQEAMARYLNGCWTGRLTMRYSNDAGQAVSTPCQVTWDFELAATSRTSGRGQETRDTEGEGTTVTAFSWAVNHMGGIELSFDPATEGGDPVNMLVAYSTLDCLNAEQFQGTAVGVNFDEEDDFTLYRAQYSKPTRSQATTSKTFEGRGKGQALPQRGTQRSGAHR